MIELKLTFATFEEAADAMLRLAGETVTVSTDTAVAVAAAAEGKTEPAKRARKAKEEKAAEEEKQNISTGDDDRTDPETEAAAGEPAFASDEEAEAFFKGEVRPALSRYMAKHGQDPARKFLHDYAGLSTKSLSSLPVEHYRGFVAACDAA